MLKNGLNRRVFAAVAAFSFSACGGDTTPLDDSEGELMGDDDMGPVADDDDTGPGPEPTMPPADPGENDPPYDITPVEDLPMGAYECGYERVPNEKVSDFTIWNADAMPVWGDSMSLTGGEFSYQNDAEMSDPLTVDVDTAAGTAHITGNVTGYAGWGLWFGPCTNASRWTGIRFVIGGSLGVSGQLEFQIQTNNNYPIEMNNMKGACAGDWGDGCGNNSYVYQEFPYDGPEEIQTPWTDFGGGEPITEVESAQLLGIQWQFNCATGDVCEVDVILEEVSFY